MFVRRADGCAEQIEVVQPLTLVARKPEDDGMEIPKTFSVTSEEAQRMMDELWRVGVRPSAEEGSAGAMAAVQRHLEDMRTLVFAGGARP